MTTKDDISRVRGFLDAFWSDGDTAAVDAIMAPDAVNHRLADQIRAGRLPPGTAAEKGMRKRVATAFPDMTVEVDLVLGGDGTVAAGWLVRGTHLGPFGNVPPTGRSVTSRSLAFYRMHEGRIAESWVELDRMDLARALGLAPSVGRVSWPGRLQSARVRLADRRRRLPRPPAATPAAPEEATPPTAEALLRRWVAASWSGADDELAALLAPDAVLHHLPGRADPSAPANPEPGVAAQMQVQAAARVLRRALPDARVLMEDVVTGDGDLAAARWSVTGTHLGPFGGFPATGRAVTGGGMTVLRLAAGRVAEVWQVLDELGMTEDLGLVPRDGPPPFLARRLARRARRADQRTARA